MSRVRPTSITTSKGEGYFLVSTSANTDEPKMRKATTGTKVIEPVAALVKLVVSGKCAIPGVGLWEEWQKTPSGGTAFSLLPSGVVSTTTLAKG